MSSSKSEEFETALYVETRIAMIEMPMIRLRTWRPTPSRAVTAIEAHGYVGSYYGTCTLEVSDELWWFEGIRPTAEVAAEEMRTQHDRASGRWKINPERGVSMTEAQHRHRRARAAFFALQEMGADVHDGPMFTGRLHGPWTPGSREYRWQWEMGR